MASADPRSPAPADIADIDLDALVQSLPACKRCRECRRGCDTLLPKCRQCTKAGADCDFWDHGRRELLPRPYIAELVDHVRRLTARSQLSPPASGSSPYDPPSASSTDGAPSSASTDSTLGAASTASITSSASPGSTLGLASTPTITSVASTPSIASTATVVPDAQPHVEHYFASAANSYRYLGAGSCLIKSPRLQAAAAYPKYDEDADWKLSYDLCDAQKYELVQVYIGTVHPLYPILDLSARYLAPQLPDNLTDSENFSLNMICSIACHVMPATARRRHPDGHLFQPSGNLAFNMGNAIRYRDFARPFFVDAMKYLEASTVDPTIETLRSVLLLTINSLFDPQSGNIGQQVALASRLALALEYQIEVQDLGPKDTEMLRDMHSTIFSIENEIASTLDRPATFPEPDWELAFDETRPVDYLCSLYRLQHRFRKGDREAKEALKKKLPLLDSQGKLLPGLRMALHQTHLLLNPVWGSAWYVLEAVVSTDRIHTFMTPHWVYRAGTVLIENMKDVLGPNLIQLYSNALVLLELSSCKWRSSAHLSASLSDLMKRTISEQRPEWEGKLRHYDVRL